MAESLDLTLCKSNIIFLEKFWIPLLSVSIFIERVYTESREFDWHSTQNITNVWWLKPINEIDELETTKQAVFETQKFILIPFWF